MLPADKEGLTMRYRVEAEGMSGTTFTYETTGPDDATDMEVLISVYGHHGRALRSGEQSEPLGPNSKVIRLSQPDSE